MAIGDGFADISDLVARQRRVVERNFLQKVPSRRRVGMGEGEGVHFRACTRYFCQIASQRRDKHRGLDPSNVSELIRGYQPMARG